MGTRGLRIVRHRGRYYVYWNQYDSYPEGLGKEIVSEIPKSPKAFETWLADQRAKYDAENADLEEYLTVVRTDDSGAPAEEQEDRDPEHEYQSVRQVSCGERAPRVGSWASKERLYDLPRFSTQSNDLYVEWVYTIDLDHQTFSVDNKAHFKLAAMPRFDWIPALGLDDQDERCLELDQTPLHAIGAISRPVQTTSPDAEELYQKLNAKIVNPKGLAGFIPSQRHGPLLCNTLFRDYRENEVGNLEQLLGSWDVEDFAFREYAHILLCFASLSHNVALADPGKILRQNREGYVNLVEEAGYEDPAEFVAVPGTGCHLAENPPGAWPESTTYWFVGALIRLVPSLHTSADTQQHIVPFHRYCKTQYPGRSINGALLSIASVVLLKVYADGKLEHTKSLPLFHIANDYTVNKGVDESMMSADPAPESNVEELEPVQEETEETSDGEVKKSEGTEVKMMNWFDKLIFGGPDQDFGALTQDWKEIHKKGDATSESKVENTDGVADIDGLSSSVAGVTVDQTEDVKSNEQLNTVTAAGTNINEETESQAATEEIAGKHHTVGSETPASTEPSPDKDTANPLAGLSSHSSLQYTAEGFVMTRYNDDGTVMDSESYRETVRGGVPVIEKIKEGAEEQEETVDVDFGFMALAQFLDATAREKLTPCSPSKGGTIPIEALSLIINSLDDVESYRACLAVSRVFRDVCLENFRLDNDSLFLPNVQSRDDGAVTDNTVSQFGMMNRYDKSVHQFSLGRDKSSRGYFEPKIPKLAALIGNERDRRLFISVDLAFNPVQPGDANDGAASDDD